MSANILWLIFSITMFVLFMGLIATIGIGWALILISCLMLLVLAGYAVNKYDN